MKRDNRLLFGPLAACILGAGIAGLAFMVPGYSHIRQTVSEIGEMDSPARLPFAVMLCCVAFCLAVFATAVRSESRKSGHAQASAWLIGFMALSAAGVGIFAFPHPLHNIFGESELIGYQAPLAFALTWRGDPKARRLVAFSWCFALLVWISIALNLSSLFRDAAIWSALKPVYGLVQRSLFAAWFGWCAGIGALLWRLKAAPPTPD